jgi:hypothetical protein
MGSGIIFVDVGKTCGYNVMAIIWIFIVIDNERQTRRWLPTMMSLRGQNISYHSGTTCRQATPIGSRATGMTLSVAANAAASVTLLICLLSSSSVLL